MGQHLLIDRGVLERILEASSVGPNDVVLEVGPGIGTLTRALAARAHSVVAVETDKRLRPVLAETLEGLENVRVLFMDALKLTPEDLVPDEPTRLIANLPYNVAATLVLALLDRLPTVTSGTVMVQREVGERMAAQPRTKAYGAYTVKLALRAAARPLFRVGPSVFLPPPRVESAVVGLERVPPPEGPSLPIIDAVVDAAFGQRRKMLRSALAAGLVSEKKAVEQALLAAGIAPTGRAEDLTTRDFVRLATECDRRSLVNLRSYPTVDTIARRRE
jgi:16S rRNA (adenine1518-N6/adenine1519-N6)-dimethyltransferase